MNKSKKENLVKIIFGVVAFVLIVVIIIMLFFRKGFANLTNKQLICENTSLGYKTKSTIIYKSNNMYEENFYGEEEPLTS